MHDTTYHTQQVPVGDPQTISGVPLDTGEVVDSIFPYKGIEQDELLSWLIFPRTSSSRISGNDSLHITPSRPTRHLTGAFYPPLPKRIWTEKQYTPLPIQDSWITNATTHSISFIFLLFAILLSVYIRFRFWKYYAVYAKLIFHPRTLPRVSEIDGPHIAQFHFIVDLTNLFSLSSIIYSGLQTSPQHTYIGYDIKPFFLPIIIFIVLFLYYVIRYVALHISSYLIKQPQTAQIIWRQYFFVHRLLWPYYLAIGLLALFTTAPIATYITYIGVLLIPLVTLFGQLRVLLTFLYFHYNLFYYFLYLWGLGIAPWLGLIRWLQLV